MTIDLAGMGGIDLLDGLALVGFFRQHDAAGHGLDIGIGEFDGDGKAVAEALQQGHAAGQGGLAGADQQQPAVELLAQRFGHLLHFGGALGAVANEELHLVQHQHSQGELAVAGQHLTDNLDEIGGGDILDDRELVFEDGTHLARVGREIGIDFFQRFGDDRADVEIIQLSQQALAGFFHFRRDLLKNVVLFKPEPEAGLGIGGRQPHGAKEDAEDGEANAFTAAGRECAGRGVKAARTTAEGIQFSQQIGDLDRQVRQSTR